MQSRTWLLTAVALNACIVFGAAAVAADLPKEGTYSGTYAGFGTAKVTAIAKERLLVAFDENALKVGAGLLDHTTSHCFGLQDVANGMGEVHGYCVGTDPDGDQVVGNAASDGKFASGGKKFSGKVTWTTGTGKYTGISGGHTYVLAALSSGRRSRGLTRLTPPIGAVTNSHNVGITDS